MIPKRIVSEAIRESRACGVTGADFLEVCRKLADEYGEALVKECLGSELKNEIMCTICAHERCETCPIRKPCHAELLTVTASQ